MNLVWAHPESFWALLPVAVWLVMLWRRGPVEPEPPPQLRHPALDALLQPPADTQRPHRADSRRRQVMALQALAAVLTVTALAQPQQLGAWVQPAPWGRDIALVIDTSLTMSLEDFRQDGRGVSRMAMLKSVLGDFVRRREADRFALAVFGSQAASLTPPTFDRDHVLAQLRRLQVGTIGDDTALGDALGLALAPLHQRQGGKLPPVIILVSDGEPANAGDMTPAEAVAVARQLGVAIHTLQIGAPSRPADTASTALSDGGAINPSASSSATLKPPPAPSTTEDSAQPDLADIARLTGARHWKARSTETVREVMRDIDRLAVTLQPPPTERERREWFALPLALALLAGAAARLRAGGSPAFGVVS